MVGIRVDLIFLHPPLANSKFRSHLRYFRPSPKSFVECPHELSLGSGAGFFSYPSNWLSLISTLLEENVFEQRIPIESTDYQSLGNISSWQWKLLIEPLNWKRGDFLSITNQLAHCFSNKIIGAMSKPASFSAWHS